MPPLRGVEVAAVAARPVHPERASAHGVTVVPSQGPRRRFLIRPLSLWSIASDQRALIETKSEMYRHTSSGRGIQLLGSLSPLAWLEVLLTAAKVRGSDMSLLYSLRR